MDGFMRGERNSNEFGFYGVEVSLTKDIFVKSYRTGSPISNGKKYQAFMKQGC